MATDFSRKQEKYRQKYPDSKVILVSAESDNNVKFKCADCGKIDTVTWLSLYHWNRRFCKECRYQGVKEKNSIPFPQIVQNLAEVGLEIVNASEWENTHTKCDIRCKMCGTTRSTKYNAIFSRKKTGTFSCKCIQSMPNFVSDIIYEKLLESDPGAKREFRFNDSGSRADIYLPSQEMLIEVKFGPGSLGVIDPIREVQKKRLLHLKAQIENYLSSGKSILYLIISRMEDFSKGVSLPPSFQYFFLDNFSESPIYDLLGEEFEEQLNELFLRPYLIRSLSLTGQDRYSRIRQKLKDIIISQGGKMPSQSELRVEFGSQGIVDRALGISTACRSPRERAKAVSKILDINLEFISYNVGKNLGCNSLKVSRPDLFGLLDQSTLNGFPGDEITIGMTRKKFGWFCERCKSPLEHFLSPAAMLKRKAGCVCTRCRSLSVLHPNLVNEWCFQSNNKLGLDPEALTPGSNKIAVWFCSKNSSHPIYPASISNRALRGSGCPSCANKTPVPFSKDMLELLNK